MYIKMKSLTNLYRTNMLFFIKAVKKSNKFLVVKDNVLYIHVLGVAY